MTRLSAPASGVTVRMYRSGHGDCFLLAFPDGQGGTTYALIDCGYTPGSFPPTFHMKDVLDDLRNATGGHIHLVIVTHEHRDHVNGFGTRDSQDRMFADITIDRLWLAWTEDGQDSFANELRVKHKDTLLEIAELRSLLGASSDPDDKSLADSIGEILDLELELPPGLLGTLGMQAISNKEALQKLRIAAGAPDFLRPDEPPRVVPGTAGVLAYTLGPPRNELLLKSMDPEEGEGFHRDPDDHDHSDFAAAARAAAGREVDPARLDAHRPFSRRYGITPNEAERGLNDAFFRTHYGFSDRKEEGPAWRRIDLDWLRRIESLALKMGDYTNNTTLVLAFELPNTEKVLLFTGDAQRGNWVSWDDQDWARPGAPPDAPRITTKDLLRRTVLYKVGHHGSHNATLKGDLNSDHPNLAWMGLERPEEFAAMLPVNSDWALNKSKPWIHPLPSIRDELLKKANGRVLRADTNPHVRPADMSQDDWNAWSARIEDGPTWVDYQVLDG